MDVKAPYHRQLMDVCLMKFWKSESVMKLYASIKSGNYGVSRRQASETAVERETECKDQCYFRSSYYVSEAEKNFGCKRNQVEWRLTQ